MNSDSILNKKTTLITVTPRSRSGRSVFRETAQLRLKTFNEFLPPYKAADKIITAFTREGCTLEAYSRVGLTFSLSTDLAISIFKCEFSAQRIKYIRDLKRWELTPSTPLVTPFMHELIDTISVPKSSFELVRTSLPSATAPILNKYHLKVPNDIQNLAGVGKLHENGVDGSGVSVVMIDSGLWAHPYFTSVGATYRVIPASHFLNPVHDERGHGTAMSSVLLSIAPKIHLTLVKMSSREIGLPVAAFQKAIQIRPKLISCSWGTIGYEPQLFLEIVNALDLGIHVVFAAGNGSDDNRKRLFQSVAHPETITVGGAWIPEEGYPYSFSDISSSFDSYIFPGRHVPDLCGPCGQLPNAHLILFPTEPGSDFDQRNGKTDGTGQFDGWLLSSGTSGATVWVAGHMALLLQLDPNIGIHNMKKELLSYCEAMDGCQYGFLAAKYF